MEIGVTYHGAKRFYERFPAYRLGPQFRASQEFHVDQGTQYRLSPCHAVFVVREQKLITTLTIPLFNAMGRRGARKRLNRLAATR